MNHKQITLDQWYEIYRRPLDEVVLGAKEPSDEIATGLAGNVIDGILAVKDIDGQYATDWECVLIIEEYIAVAKMVEGRLP